MTTNFTDGQTVVTAAWLNSVDKAVNQANGAAQIPYTPPGTGAVATTVAAKFAQTISALDFGFSTSATGVSNYTSLANAITACGGAKLRIPAGTYAVTVPSGVAFTMPANIVIEGDGKNVTILQFSATSSAYYAVFQQSNSGLTFKDISLRITPFAAGQSAIIGWAANFLSVINCELDGGQVDLTTNQYLFNVASGAITMTDFVMTGCDIHRFNSPFLKINAATSIQTRMKIYGNNFYNNVNTDCSLNSPKGACSQVEITGNTFSNPAGPGLGVSFQLAIALASVTEVVVSGNTINGAFGGASTGAIHCEEACKSLSISGNTINVSAGTGAGIVLVDNNVGTGSFFAPSGVVIANNSILESGTITNTFGISVTPINTTANNITITGNNIIGFANGIFSSDTEAQNLIVEGNTIDSCTNGISATDGGLSVEGNETSNCAVGIFGSAGTGSILVKDHTFNNCTNNCQSVSVNRPFVLVNPSYKFYLASVGAGSTTNLTLFSENTNDRAHGFLMETTWNATAAPANVVNEYEVTWDGTTSTNTTKFSYSPGAVTLALVRVGTVLVAQLFSTNLQNAIRVEAKLNGAVSQLL